MKEKVASQKQQERNENKDKNFNTTTFVHTLP
jgi:hypothetical protein